MALLGQIRRARQSKDTLHYVKVPLMRSSILLGRSMACISAINLRVQFT